MNTTIQTILILAFAGALCACGAHSDEHPMTGTYVLDVEKTVQASAMLQGQSGTTAQTLTMARMRTDFAPDAYWLELRGDRTFELVVIRDEERFTLSGTWGDVDAGLELHTTDVDGAPPPDEGNNVETVAIEDGDTLVFTQADKTLHLKRR